MEKNIDASEAIPVLAQAIHDLQARVEMLERCFAEIAARLHETTVEAKERLAGRPQQKPTNLN